jgi:hypothetical protein
MGKCSRRPASSVNASLSASILPSSRAKHMDGVGDGLAVASVMVARRVMNQKESTLQFITFA